MTNKHSVTMLSDLIEQLESDIDRYEISTSQALARAYAAGADQQLEQAAKWLDTSALFSAHLTITPPGDALRQAMRSKPPSLKEQALEALDEEHADMRIQNYKLIRSVLESLPS